MQSDGYDNPEIEARWLKEQRQNVLEYFDKEEIRLAKIEEKPIWRVAPYVALWKAKNSKSSFWIISGDLPSDYLEAFATKSPSEILAAFAKRWEKMSVEMLKGNFPADFKIGKIQDQKELGGLLKSRAQVLLDWSKDKQLWQ